MAAKGEAHSDATKVDAAYRDALKAAYQILSFPRDDFRIFCPDNIHFSNENSKVEFRIYMLDELMNLINFTTNKVKKRNITKSLKPLFST